ncbi:MAG: 1-deoxy-D-xylulose-5-phosphate synthase [Chloroflexia bacterium]|nr:1-deoxy-D-xylulose-5-phosphate synthase [Chloroflexia bacterium]
MASILDQVNQPADLERLTGRDLRRLAEEIRQELIEVVPQTGGHLASNLGVVELTIALHTVLDSPRDQIVWDVGHQAYVHKLLTERKDRFRTIRQYGGLSGFTKRSESPHDPFGAGHAATSISAALGIARGRDLQGEDFAVVAVIGDGAMTGGMSFEALNHAGHMGTRLIVILNDNGMSIAPNVGALSPYLNRLRSDPRYHQAKGRAERLLVRMPLGRRLLHFLKRLKNSFKEFLIPTRIWDEMGFTYIGPVDGHDIGALVRTLRSARRVQGPVLLHVYTTKGKGYAPAEQDPTNFHGVSPNGRKKSAAPSYSQVFGQTMVQMAEADSRLVAITAAMPDGTGLSDFAQRFPGRLFDVGIAEQHAVTFAAGLATRGLRPVVAIYSTFLQRSYDQLIHDVALQELPVIFALDRAGIVGDDGATHNGVFDLAYLRHIPNLVVMAPKDECELQRMLWTALEIEGPVAIRYPRGSGRGLLLDREAMTLPLGMAEVLRKGAGGELAILAIGSMVYPALGAAELLGAQGIEAAVINARFVKPLDKAMLYGLARNFQRIVTVEENALQGGFGSAVLEFYERKMLLPDHQFLRIGIPDRFIHQGPQHRMRAELNLSAEGIAQVIRNRFPDLWLVLEAESEVAAPPLLKAAGQR